MDRFIAHRVIKGANVYVQPEEVVLYSDVKRLEDEITELKDGELQFLLEIAELRANLHKTIHLLWRKNDE